MFPWKKYINIRYMFFSVVYGGGRNQTYIFFHHITCGPSFLRISITFKYKVIWFCDGKNLKRIQQQPFTIWWIEWSLECFILEWRCYGYLIQFFRFLRNCPYGVIVFYLFFLGNTWCFRWDFIFKSTSPKL